MSILCLSVLCGCSSGDDFVGKQVIIPGHLLDQSPYTLIYVIHNQECTRCSVSALYQWKDVISSVGRDDIHYLFVVETRPEDTQDVIDEALERRPFDGHLYIDYSHGIINDNAVLQKMLEDSIDCFIIDSSQTIVSIGNPLEDFHYMLEMTKM